MMRKLVFAILIGFVVAPLLLAAEPASEDAKPVRIEGVAFLARALPDRIVLTPGADPAHQMAVSFRTNTGQSASEAQLAPALDGPSLEARAKLVTGTAITDAGDGIYHHIAFTGLSPDSAYVYRVKGTEGWSEWFQFRTAAEGFKPFRFLYFGDTQNNILPIASRVIRQAFYSTAAPALALHAGDLVDQRNEKAADDAWGEWNAAGSYNYAIVPQIPAAGNHEYMEKRSPGGAEKGSIGPWFGANFALPDNGAETVKSTTYFTDYQGVRFVVLDGTAATEKGALKPQIEWLERVLSQSPSRWKVVMFHQPLFMCARPTDLTEWKAALQPVLEKYDVDLALSGHDHCYSRISNPGSKQAGSKPLKGPVYMISVTGSKMYGLNTRVAAETDRVAEDTEFYQVISVEADKLRVEAHTATGRLYDSFEILRGKDGKKRLIDGNALPPQRVCTGKEGPDGLPCSSRAK